MPLDQNTSSAFLSGLSSVFDNTAIRACEYKTLQAERLGRISTSRDTAYQFFYLLSVSKIQEGKHLRLNILFFYSQEKEGTSQKSS